MRFTVIGDYETVLGFRLAGVQGRVAQNRLETLDALAEAITDRGVGIVLLTETLAAEIREEFDARLYGHGFPLLIEIPDGSGPLARRLSIEHLLHRAVGIKL